MGFHKIRRGMAAVAAAALVFSLTACTKTVVVEKEAEQPKIGYATQGVTVVEDGDALQKAVDKMKENAANGGFSLEYKGVAESSDGVNFNCYIANSEKNAQDLYIQIFADAGLTDELFLSGLIRPGQAFESVTLNRPLEKGTHTVYLVHTKVTEDFAIHSQTTVTAEFTVK